jgi:hypothetical protein
MEILFLTKYGHMSDTIVYVGASPGQHILQLKILFPKHKWILIDPRPISIKIRNDDIFLQKCMTTTMAEQFKHKKYLLISDVRSCSMDGELYGMPLNDSDTLVQNDMDNQLDWVQAGKFVMSSLKFRLPWDNKFTHYLDGELHCQPWIGEFSTETRLFTTGSTMRFYSNKKYEDQCYYYNYVVRTHVRPPLALHVKTHDQMLEYSIATEYLERCKADDITTDPLKMIMQYMIKSIRA